MPLTQTTDLCPECRGALVRPETGQPWCPACEWNLGVYDPEVVPARGWRWLDRHGHRLALRLDRALFARFALERPSQPGWTAARAVLVAISAILVLLPLGCLALGMWLIVHDFPSWRVLPGLLLIGVAIGLRPRLGRLPQRRLTLRRDQAATLFALIDRVAAAAGASAPDVVAVEPAYNARTARAGLRRRSVLSLGIPLWMTLPPALRVALLAHELGHQVNGDPSRGLLVRPALDTFRILAQTTGVDRTLGGIATNERWRGNFLEVLADLVLWALSRVFLLAHVGLSALAMRDHQRAEYLADAVAVDVAGTDPVVALLDRLVLLPPIVTLLAYNAETTGPERWRTLADSFHRSRAGELPQLRQLTTRDTSIWDSHPPAGLRARMVEAWPRREPAVALTDEDSDRIDRELAGWYAATHRRILGTRDFRPARSR
jgi:heat shock protein HtpX